MNRNQQTQNVGGTERPINTNDLPANLQGDLAAMAASLPGVVLAPGLDGGADGFSVLGLGTDAGRLLTDARGAPPCVKTTR